MSQTFNDEITVFKIEIEKLKEERLSQKSSCETLQGTIPSVLQTHQQQEEI